MRLSRRRRSNGKRRETHQMSGNSKPQMYQSRNEEITCRQGISTRVAREWAMTGLMKKSPMTVQQPT